MKPVFTGCGTALITPFKGGEIDYEAFDRIIEEQIEGGVDALIAAGTTGEPATMTWEEHLAVIEHVAKRAAGRVPVIAGTGSNSTKEAVEAAKACRDSGAVAQLVVTPYYNKTSQEGLIAHFLTIADSDTLPVIVYNVPSRTGINIEPMTLKTICEHPRVVAVKEANGDVPQALEKLRLCGDQAAFYSGNDDLIAPLMACGYQGVISVLSNVMPRETADMAHLLLRGETAKGAALQLKYLPFIKALFSETSPIPCKAAMGMMGKCDEEVRLPLVPMQPARRAAMESIMKELGLL